MRGGCSVRARLEELIGVLPTRTRTMPQTNIKKVTFAAAFLMLLAAGTFARPAGASLTSQTSHGVVIRNDHPLIHFHGRWDSSPGTWWYVRVPVPEHTFH